MTRWVRDNQTPSPEVQLEHLEKISKLHFCIYEAIDCLPCKPEFEDYEPVWQAILARNKAMMTAVHLNISMRRIARACGLGTAQTVFRVVHGDYSSNMPVVVAAYKRHRKE